MGDEQPWRGSYVLTYPRERDRNIDVVAFAASADAGPQILSKHAKSFSSALLRAYSGQQRLRSKIYGRFENLTAHHIRGEFLRIGFLVYRGCKDNEILEIASGCGGRLAIRLSLSIACNKSRRAGQSRCPTPSGSRSDGL